MKKYKPRDARISAQTYPPDDFWRFFSGPELRASPALWADYRQWELRNQEKSYALFKEEYMRTREQMETAMANWPSPFVNATKGKAYEITFTLPDCVYCFEFSHQKEKTGLEIEVNGRECAIRGIPQVSGEHEIALIWIYPGWRKGTPCMVRKFKLFVNHDPAELWKNIPSDPELEYHRPDTEAEALDCENATLWGASQRGRSHAHSGGPRDDAFGLACQDGWKIMAVADGAGSAAFSRKGAEIACKTAVDVCKAQLAEASELNALFDGLAPLTPNADWLAQAKKLAYNILPNAFFAAHKAIRAEAEQKGRDAKVYATTLLLCVAREFAGGWAVLSFQVGDGAMGMFARGNAELLAEPDEGEYGGQTRFITMNEIYDAHELMRRLRIDFVEDLLGLILVTDGVSDARFVTLEGLRDPALWQELWQELAPMLEEPDPERQLLSWLNFWSKGNHDDRTIAIMRTNK